MQNSNYCCELLIRAKMVPDRAGADTRVDVIIPLSDLRRIDGASVIEDAWLRARAGEHGYLSGKDAEAAACDLMIAPVVTGSPAWDLIGDMIDLVTGAYNHVGATPGTPLPPQAWEALQYALARLAISFVSGPGALASALRRSLLDPPLNGKSAPLDIGYSDTIPESIRKAVIMRDKGCAWPGCNRRPSACDVHQVKHKKHGGKTSTSDCVVCVSTTTTSASTATAGTSSSSQTDQPAPRTTPESPTQRITPSRLTPTPADNPTGPRPALDLNARDRQNHAGPKATTTSARPPSPNNSG